MTNKTLFYLLFFAFSISNCFAMQDPTRISKAEQTYYEDDREWEYLERILIRRIEEVKSETNIKINRITMGAFAGILTLFAYLVKDEIKKKPISETISVGIFASGFIGFIVFIANIGSKFIFHKRIHNERFVNILEMFLQKYNPEIDFENDNINYKKIIPKELHKTFDVLHEEYTMYGKKYLKESSIEILRSIIDKITYEIKREKYKAIRENQTVQAQSIGDSMNTAILAEAIRSNKK